MGSAIIVIIFLGVILVLVQVVLLVQLRTISLLEKQMRKTVLAVGSFFVVISAGAICLACIIAELGSQLFLLSRAGRPVIAVAAT